MSTDSTLVQFNLPNDLLVRLDAYVEKMQQKFDPKWTRAAALRTLVKHALMQEENALQVFHVPPSEQGKQTPAFDSDAGMKETK